MRTFAAQAALSSLTTGFPHVPYFRVRAYNQLLRFSPYAVSADVTEDFGICPSGWMQTGSNVMLYSGWRAGVGLYKASITLSSGSAIPTIGTSQGGASAVAAGTNTCLRGSYDSDYNFWSARWSWDGNATVYVNGSSFATISYPMRNGATFVRRVDAVYWTSLGIVVIVGCYDFSQKLATQRFFWIDNAANVSGLDAIVQTTMTETYTNWYTHNKVNTFGGAAVYNGKVVIVTNDGARPLRFHVNRGAESMVEPVVGLEPELTDHKILPTNVMTMGGKLYMSYSMRRKQSDDTLVNLAGYSSSDDGVNWSVGEHSSFIAATSNPVILLQQTPDTVVYAVGGGTAFTATARPIDNGGSFGDVSSKINGGRVDMSANSSDQLTLLVNDVDPLAAVGNVFQLEAGMLDNSSVEQGGEIGRYVAIDIPKPVTQAGLNRSQLTGLDLSSWKLKQWASSIDVDRWSYTDNKDTLADMSKMIIKLTQTDVTFAATGFASAALDDPFVGFKTTTDPRDGILRVNAKFNNPDTANSLSSVGLAFGGSDDAYNVFLVPKATSWTGHNPQLPRVLQSNLDPNNKWAVDDHTTGVWESVLSDTFARLHTHPNATASGSDEYFFLTGSGPIPDGQEHALFLRKAGRRVQVYKKRIASQLSDMTTYSTVTLIGELYFNEWRKQAHGSYWGVVAGTDVPASREWYQCSRYGDISATMTSVSDLYSISEFTQLIGTASFAYSPGGSGTCSSVNLTSGAVANLPGGTIPTGWYIKIVGANQNAVFQVGSRVSGAMNSNFVAGLVNGISTASSNPVNIYVFGVTNRFGWASSASTSDYNPVADTQVIRNTGAIKQNMLSIGYGVAASDDNSAVSQGLWVTDGVVHDKMTAGINGMAWDVLTNPTEGTGSSGSTPSAWRFIMNPGLLFPGDPSQYGLPSSSVLRFKVDDEVLMGVKQTYVLPGFQSLYTGCFIPTFYRPLAAVARNSLTLKGWKSGGGNQPGDLFTAQETTMGSAYPGMLVEISSRTASFMDESSQYYAVDAFTSGGDDYLTLDHAYSGTTNDLEAMAIVSGRGQFGTIKTAHDADAPVRLYPSSAKIESLIGLRQFDLVAGLYNSTEDDIKSTVALAGVDNAAFRSSGSYSGNLGTTIVTVSNASETFSDFVLELNAHLFADKGLSIYFRDNYRLDLAVADPSGWSIQGHKSVIRARLVATNLGGTYLEDAVVHDSGTPHFGTFSGDAYTDQPTYTCDLRVVVRGNLVVVELERQMLWQFNLESYATPGVTAFYRTPATVYMQYSATTSTPIVARLQELSDEVENHVIDQGSSGLDSIGEIMSDRHIKSRSTQTGGLEFSRFIARDEANPITSYVRADTPIDSNLEPVGHINMVGAEMGEVIDSSWIINNGYRFGMGNNKLLNTVQDSQREARVSIRDSKSYASQRTLDDLTARLWMQPEDKFQIVYGGTVPSPDGVLTVEYRVADTVSFEFADGVLVGTYQTRKHYD